MEKLIKSTLRGTASEDQLTLVCLFLQALQGADESLQELYLSSFHSRAVRRFVKSALDEAVEA